MAKPNRATEQQLAPQADAQPTEPSVALDEHRGLAARIGDLRKVVEDHRQTSIRERAHMLQRVAELDQQVVAIGTRVDREVEALGRMQRDLEAQLRESSEQVRQAGALARKMTDQVKELEELREMASDPHEVVKPIQRGLALLRGDLEALGRTIDIRFEQMPKGRGQSIESRSEDENPIVKLAQEIRALKTRLAALEPD